MHMHSHVFHYAPGNGKMWCHMQIFVVAPLWLPQSMQKQIHLGRFSPGCCCAALQWGSDQLTGFAESGISEFLNFLYISGFLHFHSQTGDLFGIVYSYPFFIALQWVNSLKCSTPYIYSIYSCSASAVCRFFLLKIWFGIFFYFYFIILVKSCKSIIIASLL